jgi:3-methylfumaryl-CoA hydratase
LSAQQTTLAGQVGRAWERIEVLTAAPVDALAALLDKPRPESPQELPPLAHWLYFLPLIRQSLLGSDGHPLCDEIVPPPHFPRRMWVGGHVEFLAPLHVGSRVTRHSMLESIEEKNGRSGPLMLVTLHHELSGPSGLAIRERQDLVYRAQAEGAPPVPSSGGDTVSPVQRDSRVIRADSVLLFRFSALTFNAHRIHFDRDYARHVEGYPGLVVHAPLIAMLMLDHALEVTGNAAVVSYTYRNHLPLFDDAAFTLDAVLTNDRVTGDRVAVRTIDAAGRLAATAAVKLRAGALP